MTFNEWYKKHREFNYDAVYAPHESKVAWNACKNEILKILNNNIVIVNICDTQLQKDAEQFIDIKAIKEIEKI